MLMPWVVLRACGLCPSASLVSQAKSMSCRASEKRVRQWRGILLQQRRK
jgi:hypothetical protein